MAVSLFAVVCFLALFGTAGADDHSATRRFFSSRVDPGGRLEVSVSAAGYGAFAHVVETLPDGFEYEDSDLPDAAVSVDGQTVAFTLMESSSFTYTAIAPFEEGTYTFTGVIRSQTRHERRVTGAAYVRVGAPPTPTPEPTATPTATPTPDSLRPTAYPNADSHANVYSHAYA